VADDPRRKAPVSVRAKPWSGRRIHFVGVGGAGMSGYARVAHALGATVTGSDRAETPYLTRLREERVLDARIGHDAANVPSGDGVELVHSSAIPADNPEREAARERGLPDRPRADLLAQLSALRRTIAVAGAHGKTTTAAMIVRILRGEGIDPGWLIGSSLGGGLANSHWSAGEWLVIEADESDRSMLSLAVEVAVLTNVELDHHATFATLADLRDCYRAFLALATHAIVVWNRPELLSLVPERRGGGSERAGASAGRAAPPATAPPGLTESLATAFPRLAEPHAGAPTRIEVVPYDAPQPLLSTAGASFAWRGQQVQLRVPGAHNALNATAALEAASLAGADPGRAPAWLAGFAGAGRRFEHAGTSGAGALLINDYAHHPSEVRATLQAARTLAPRRLVAVLQPHLFSRTAMLAREFGQALAQADVIAVLDVYPARERAEDFPGVSGLTIARAAAERAAGRTVLWLPELATARGVLAPLLREGDLCLVMGAGDVDVLARELAA
jgi:UDP-N-acetylmuramate--alanine ligase